jgi:hypothetical protein
MLFKKDMAVTSCHANEGQGGARDRVLGPNPIPFRSYRVPTFEIPSGRCLRYTATVLSDEDLAGNLRVRSGGDPQPSACEQHSPACRAVALKRSEAGRRPRSGAMLCLPGE